MRVISAVVITLPVTESVELLSSPRGASSEDRNQQYVFAMSYMKLYLLGHHAFPFVRKPFPLL